MGKSNRIRVNRANERGQTVVVKQKKQVPGWVLSTVTILVALAVLLTVVLGAMSKAGAFLRLSTYASTENYRVTGPMMSYFFQTTYSSFTSDNEEELEAWGLDTSAALKSQTYGGEEDFEGTWYDFFAKETKETVQILLIYAEEAARRGITLTETDKANEVEYQIEIMQMYADMYQVSLDTYVESSFGIGMKSSDIRKALELTALANKCRDAIADDMVSSYDTPEGQTEVANRYNENPKLYNEIDYLYYTYTVNFADAAAAVLGTSDYTDAQVNEKKAEIYAKYRELIAVAKANADSLGQVNDPAAFKDKVLEDALNQHYDKVYAAATIDAASLPEEAVRNDMKAKIIAQIKADMLADKDTSELAIVTEGEGDAKVTKIFDTVVKEAYATAMKKVYADVLEDIVSDKSIYFRSNIGYVETDAFSKWAFEAGRVTNENHLLYSGDQEFADTAEVSSLTKNYTAKAYLLTATPYKNETVTRDIAYMLFGTKEEAQAAIAAMGTTATLNYESFETIANANGTTGVKLLVDSAEGDLSNEVMNTWLYADGRKVGDYTTEPLTLTEGSSYAVLFYMADGNQEWFANVRDEIIAERLESELETMKGQLEIKWNEKALNRIV